MSASDLRARLKKAEARAAKAEAELARVRELEEKRKAAQTGGSQAQLEDQVFSQSNELVAKAEVRLRAPARRPSSPSSATRVVRAGRKRRAMLACSLDDASRPLSRARARA